jgi:hypothetical protein
MSSLKLGKILSIPAVSQHGRALRNFGRSGAVRCGNATNEFFRWLVGAAGPFWETLGELF